jgi:hypothetical protein
MFAKVTQSGIDKTLANVAKIAKTLAHPDLNVAVRAMAGIWQSNFSGEGSAVGGWRPLTETTNRVREQRGYPREHPILVQSGTLRRAAIDSLLNVNGPRVMTGKGVMMSWQPAGMHGTLQISGEKVSNQFRIRDRTMDQPARPFWFVTPEVEQAAAAAIGQWIEGEIR